MTPPVALAAYAAASIAGASIMKTSLAAFRFALVGFTLPYMFVLRPELMMLSADGGSASWGSVLLAFGAALLGIVPLAAGIAGQLMAPVPPLQRLALFVSAALLLLPAGDWTVAGLPLLGLLGSGLFAMVLVLNFRARR